MILYKVKDSNSRKQISKVNSQTVCYIKNKAILYVPKKTQYVE